tara:strand:+ start:1296 stop:1958 length:663 start_codon:yes stop_codon:yes gene_type:complete
MRKVLKVFFLFACFFLYGCSSSYDYSNLNKAFNLLKGSLKPSNDQIKIFNQEEINSIKYPVIEIRTNGFIKQDLMLPISVRDGYSNFMSANGHSVTLQGPFLTKTNGFNTGLISLEFIDRKSIFEENKNDKYKKVYTFIDSDFNAIKYEFNCIIKHGPETTIIILQKTHDLKLIDEVCVNDKIKFTNSYFLDLNNYVWKSYQWASPKNIYFEIFTLKKDY